MPAPTSLCFLLACCSFTAPIELWLSVRWARFTSFLDAATLPLRVAGYKFKSLFIKDKSRLPVTGVTLNNTDVGFKKAGSLTPSTSSESNRA